MFNEIEICH